MLDTSSNRTPFFCRLHRGFQYAHSPLSGIYGYFYFFFFHQHHPPPKLSNKNYSKKQKYQLIFVLEGDGYSLFDEQGIIFQFFLFLVVTIPISRHVASGGLLILCFILQSAVWYFQHFWEDSRETIPQTAAGVAKIKCLSAIPL